MKGLQDPSEYQMQFLSIIPLCKIVHYVVKNEFLMFAGIINTPRMVHGWQENLPQIMLWEG